SGVADGGKRPLQALVGAVGDAPERLARPHLPPVSSARSAVGSQTGSVAIPREDPASSSAFGMARWALTSKSCSPINPIRIRCIEAILYQTRQALARIMGEPSWQANACANSGMLATTPFTRYLGSEWGSVCARSRASSAEVLAHQTWASPRKKRWAGVK